MIDLARTASIEGDSSPVAAAGAQGPLFAMPLQTHYRDVPINGRSRVKRMAQRRRPCT